MTIVWAWNTWDIIDIIWPTCNVYLSKGEEEQVILDKSLELSLSVGCNVQMVDCNV